MKTESEAPRDTMVRQTVVKDDGRYLYLYTFPKDPADDTVDVDQPEETLEDPYV